MKNLDVGDCTATRGAVATPWQMNGPYMEAGLQGLLFNLGGLYSHNCKVVAASAIAASDPENSNPNPQKGLTV